MTDEEKRKREDPEQDLIEIEPAVLRRNPRLVFTDPDDFFGRDFHDLLMEQQEQG